MEFSFGDVISIKEIIILPTQKYNIENDKWVPDSHTIFLSIQKKTTNHYIESNLTINEVTNFLESLLNLECCVDFV